MIPRNLGNSIKKNGAFHCFFLTIPGPKMIWQFGELGYDVSIESGGRTSEKPIRWNYYSETDRYRLFLIYKLLNDLKNSYEVFSTSDYSYSLSTPQKRIQLNSPGMKVNVLGNFDISSATMLPGFIQTGKWYEYFSGDSMTVVSVNDPITLQPGEYRLYTTQRLKSPKALLGIDSQKIPYPGQNVSVYPNPSKNEFTFEINISQPAPYTVSIIDLSGKLLRQEKINISAEGLQLFKWDGKTGNGSDAGKGVYFVQIQTPKWSETVKIIKN